MATDEAQPRPQAGRDGAPKRKRTKALTAIAQYSCRKPTWSYLHLRRCGKADNSSTLDEVTASLLLNSALKQFLGIHGTAIQRDFLKVDGDDFWIRVPGQDQQAVIAALSSWSRNGEMLRVMGHSSWDACAQRHDAGQDLFD